MPCCFAAWVRNWPAFEATAYPRRRATARAKPMERRNQSPCLTEKCLAKMAARVDLETSACKTATGRCASPARIGQPLQNDFGNTAVTVADEPQGVHMFVAALGCSRRVCAQRGAGFVKRNAPSPATGSAAPRRCMAPCSAQALNGNGRMEPLAPAGNENSMGCGPRDQGAPNKGKATPDTTASTQVFWALVLAGWLAPPFPHQKQKQRQKAL